MQNSVSAFAVGKDGSLTEVPGSPFLTGGRAGDNLRPRAYASNRIRVSNNLLYASNALSNDVTGFVIDAETGSLTPVPGSPFATGGSSGFGMSLALTPDGRFLYAGHGGFGGSNNLRVFGIGPEGELATVGDLVPAGEGVNGMMVTPDGRWLAVALSLEGPHGALAMFGIDPETGELALAKGSPFPFEWAVEPDGRPAGVDINCASDTLFVGEGSLFGTTSVHVLNLDPKTGALTPIKGSPFTPGVGENSNVVLLSPDGFLLFVSNQESNSVTVFSVEEGGTLNLIPGSPFPGGGAGACPRFS